MNYAALYEFVVKTHGEQEAAKIVGLIEDALDRYEHHLTPLKQRFIDAEKRFDGISKLVS